jgi:hypothetical protein
MCLLLGEGAGVEMQVVVVVGLELFCTIQATNL